MNTWKKDVLKASLPTGIITGIICGILFFLMKPTNKSLNEMALDLFLTVFLTPLICSLVQLPLKKSAIKKGKAGKTFDINNEVAYTLLPKSIPAFVILIPLFAAILFGLGAVGLVALFGASGMAAVPYTILKAVLAGASTCYMMFHLEIFVTTLLVEKVK